MRDPYLYDDVPVLKNLLGIKDAELLERAEADITAFYFSDVDGALQSHLFDLHHLLSVHKYIFGDIYEWAGQTRTIPIIKGENILGGDTVRYSHPNEIERDCETVLSELISVNWKIIGVNETAELFTRYIARLWQIHPFREGNTRTIVTFATQFAEANSFRMDKTLLKDNASYVRDALVKASDGQYSEYKYLTKIFMDAIRRG